MSATMGKTSTAEERKAALHLDDAGYSSDRRQAAPENAAAQTARSHPHTRPAKLMLLFGPPADRRTDSKWAAKLARFTGRKVICGGSTSQAIARELGRQLELDLSTVTPQAPPVATMAGVDLVTEGRITMDLALRSLREGVPTGSPAPDRLGAMLAEADEVNLVVGEASKEGDEKTISFDLAYRHRLARKVAATLRGLGKQVNVEYC